MPASNINDQAVFDVARKIDSRDARQAYLNQVCGDDAAMAQRVGALLRAYDESASFLESPAGAAYSPTIAERPLTEAPGTVIGPYKLLEQIGEGGMGVVYMAEQTEPVERRVAVKVIKPGMDTRQVIARFEAERQALAMMDHPNIAKVLDAGTTGGNPNTKYRNPKENQNRKSESQNSPDEGVLNIRDSDLEIPSDFGFRDSDFSQGRPFFVMELVKGLPITRYCDEHHLSLRERLELFVPVLQAVQHAHQKGIIHRDLKPTNVLVAEYDDRAVPKIIDFGVAKAVGGKLTDKTMFTQLGQLVGTLEYMSPEQAKFNQLDVDTRTDIYALGVLLYELLTGTTPFGHERLHAAAFDEVLRILRDEEPPKPSTRLTTIDNLASVAVNRHIEPARLNRLVRGELDWIVMKALEKDRNRRYETANGFAADVLHHLADEPVLACPPSATYRFRKFARRNKGALAMAGVVFAALLLATIGLAVSNVLVRAERNEKIAALGQKEQALGEKQAALGEKEAALTEAKANYAEAKRQEGLAQTSAEHARQQQQIAQEQEGLARRRFYAAQMNLALQAWEEGRPARMLQLLESQRPRFDEEDLRGFDWFYLWGLCQGTYRYSLPTRNYDNATPIAISPDGATLASGYGRAVRLWDMSTGRQIGELPGHDNLVGWVVFAGDGKTLASSDESATVRLWDLATLKVGVTITAGQDVTGIQFTGDSQTLVLGGKRVKLWDVAANRELTTLGESDKKFWFVAVAPDGNTVAASNMRGVRIWTRDGSAWHEARALVDVGYCAPIDISPDSKLLAVGYNSLKLYDLASLQELTAFQGHTGPVFAVAFSGDGKRLGSSGLDRTVRMWDVATGEQQACLANPGPVYGLALAPDAGVVAAMGTDAIRVWDVVPPGPALVLRHTTPVRAVAFSPDGKTLASYAMDGTKLWDLVDGREIATVAAARPRNAWGWNLAFSPDGGSLATTGVAPQTLEVWSVSGRQLAILNHEGIMNRVVYSPDGTLLAAASDNGAAVVWDLAAQQRRHTLPVSGSTQATSVAFSPDGKTIAAAGQFGVVKLFDVESGRELNTLQRFELAVDWIWSVAFSPDGRKLAAANNQGVVRIWDVATNRLKATLIGHTDAVKSLAFVDDGRTLVTGSEDCSIRLWDVETGQERITLKGHEQGVTGVACAPDGDLLATSSSDGTVRLWRAAVDRNARDRKRETDSNDAPSPAAGNELGDRLWQYGRTDEAEAAYRHALRRLEKLIAGAPDEVAYKQELVRCLLSISLLLWAERDHHPDAEPLRLRARELYRELSPEQQAALLFAYGERHRNLYDSGHGPQVQRTFSQMIELMPEDDVAGLTRASQHLTGCSDVKLRNTTRAVEFARQAVAASRKHQSERSATGVMPTHGVPLVAAPSKDRSERAGALAYLGVALENDGRRAEAESPYREAVALYHELSDEFPVNEWYRQERAYFSLALANVLQAAGRTEEAVDYCRTTLRLDEQLAADFPEHPTHAERLRQARGALISLLSSLGRDAETEEAGEILLKGNPSAGELNSFAWSIISRSGASAGAARQAIVMAQRGVDLDPNFAHCWNTLGVAHYRAGNWAAAITALQKSRELQQDKLISFDAFFLAMSYWHLNDTDRAHVWYERGVAWMNANAPNNEELKRFRAEAAALIGSDGLPSAPRGEKPPGTVPPTDH